MKTKFYTQDGIEYWNNEEYSGEDDVQCALCSDTYRQDDCKLIEGVYICSECQESEDTLIEFETIENAVNWYKKHNYIKS